MPHSARDMSRPRHMFSRNAEMPEEGILRATLSTPTGIRVHPASYRSARHQEGREGHQSHFFRATPRAPPLRFHTPRNVSCCCASFYIASEGYAPLDRGLAPTPAITRQRQIWLYGTRPKNREEDNRNIESAACPHAIIHTPSTAPPFRQPAVTSR